MRFRTIFRSKPRYLKLHSQFQVSKMPDVIFFHPFACCTLNFLLRNLVFSSQLYSHVSPRMTTKERKKWLKFRKIFQFSKLIFLHRRKRKDQRSFWFSHLQFCANSKTNRILYILLIFIKPFFHFTYTSKHVYQSFNFPHIKIHPSKFILRKESPEFISIGAFCNLHWNELLIRRHALTGLLWNCLKSTNAFLSFIFLLFSYCSVMLPLFIHCN